jgi:hypothetical protein
LFAGTALGGFAEHVRMTPDQLADDGARYVVEIEATLLLSHAGVEHHLKQEVAQLVPEVVQLAAFDRVGDLIGLLHRVRRDGGEGLLDVPGTTVHRIAQARHDGQQLVDGAEILHPAALAARAHPDKRR